MKALEALRHPRFFLCLILGHDFGDWEGGTINESFSIVGQPVYKRRCARCKMSLFVTPEKRADLDQRERMRTTMRGDRR